MIAAGLNDQLQALRLSQVKANNWSDVLLSQGGRPDISSASGVNWNCNNDTNGT